MSLKAIVFDVGGVLEVNPATGWLDRWARRLELTAGELSQRLERLWRGGDIGAVTLADLERRTAADLELSDRVVAALMDDAWTEYLGSLNRPMIEFVRGVRPHLKTGVLSNSFVGAREREEAAYGFGDLFDTIVYSHEVGHLKPEPAIYAITCERLGVEPHEVLFVDDLQANVDGARAFGMEAITFLNTEQALADLTARVARAGTSEMNPRAHGEQPSRRR